MTHVVLGYPSLEESMDIVREMAKAGASIIELQIPFSDPMADGPTIMRANESALEKGCKVADCMSAMKTLAAELETPLLFMSYFNILFSYGVEKFCKDAAEAGAAGMIVPDVPIEENQEGYWTHAKANGLAAIPLVSPITSDTRLQQIANVANDSFVYCVSMTGTTGAAEAVPAELKEYLGRVKKTFSCPVAVGFGINSVEQVRALAGIADLAIVGSAMIKKIADKSSEQYLAEVREFTAALSGQS
ncbi:UNVERIFIED_CONTAM: hypothetical protein GTU68_051874 [Idotea baltica]|nr:hypothetical protein [Idotea baltica]